MSELQPIPTAWTALATNTYRATFLVVARTGDQAIRLSIRDRQATPVYLFDEIPIGDAPFTMELGGGEFTNGIEWKASAAGLQGMITGYEL